MNSIGLFDIIHNFTVLFQLTSTFIYSTFSNRFLILTKLTISKHTLKQPIYPHPLRLWSISLKYFTLYFKLGNKTTQASHMIYTALLSNHVNAATIFCQVHTEDTFFLFFIYFFFSPSYSYSFNNNFFLTYTIFLIFIFIFFTILIIHSLLFLSSKHVKNKKTICKMIL